MTSSQRGCGGHGVVVATTFLVTTLLAGCGGARRGPQTAPWTAESTPRGKTGADSPRGPQRSLKDYDDETARWARTACRDIGEPVRDDVLDALRDQTPEHAERAACLAQLAASNLCAVAPARRDACADVVAAVSQFVKVACPLDNYRADLDPETGEVGFGSHHGIPELECAENAFLNGRRLAGMARDDAQEALAAMMQRERSGVVPMEDVMCTRAAHWADSEVDYATTWGEVRDACRKAERAKRDLVAAFCRYWPEPGRARGGERGCEAAVRDALGLF